MWKIALFIGLVGCGDDMSSPRQPPGWVINSGTWKTDIDESRTVVNSGPRSIWFKDTSPAADLEIETRAFIPVLDQRSYNAEVFLRADDVTAGSLMFAYVDLYDDDRDTPTSTVTVYNAILDAADTWELKRKLFTTASGDRFAKVRVGKDKDNTFNGYLDAVALYLAAPTWEAWDTSPRTVTASTVFTIPFGNATTADVTFNTSTGVATILVPGWYQISARELVGNFDDADNVRCGINVNGSIAKRGTRIDSIHQNGTDVVKLGVTASALLYLDVGDTVDFYVFHDSSSTISSGGSISHSYFMGTRIM